MLVLMGTWLNFSHVNKSIGLQFFTALSLLMDAALTNLQNDQQISVNDRQYFYVVTPFEVTNILGTATTVLQEYFITNLFSEHYELYKTKDGNWYDIPETNTGINTAVLSALKSAIDSEENTFTK